MQLSAMGNEESQVALTQECSELEGHLTETDASYDATHEVVASKHVSKRKGSSSESLKSLEKKSVVLSKK